MQPSDVQAGGSSLADRTDWWRRPSMDAGRSAAASASQLARLPPHAIHAAAFEPLAARQQTGFVVVAPSGEPSEAQPAESVVEPVVEPEDDEIAELNARKACASMVGTIAEGLGIPRTASAVALGDLAEQAELAGAQLQSLSMGAPLPSGVHSEKLEALEGLPPGAPPSSSLSRPTSAPVQHLGCSLSHHGGSSMQQRLPVRCSKDCLSDALL